MKMTIIVVVSSLVGAFLLAQLVPYRISNPPVKAEPAWDSPRTRELAVRACYDCHSNETKTPWYGNVAPASWYLTHHVEEGRAALNFSEWNGPPSEGVDEILRTVQEGSMPPPEYTWFGLHSKAKLTKAETDELVNGLRATLNK